MQLRLSFWLTFISLVAGLTLATPVAAQTYTSIDYPGAVKTIATGINSAGTIVGDFCFICKNNERVHGYILNQGAFTQIDFPGSVLTRPLGINDAGDIVGYSRKTTNGTDHGFLLSGGTFTAIDFPGATQTHAIGIDTAGEIFGSYCIGGNSCYGTGSKVLRNAHGFRLSGGIFTTIDFPGSIVTELWGQDSAGQIAGRYQDASGVFHAFLLSNGSFTSIDFPGAAETATEWISFVGGINASGDIASTYCTSEPCLNPSSNFHSFLLSAGTYTTIDFPVAAVTIAAGVNSSEDVVGGYFDSSGGIHGFLRTP
jgi:probable HAF family extracellular repeat protein